MSDSIKELCKQYEENVAEPNSRRLGLCTIPEYPEFEAEQGMWSTALDAILTTLRYLAPATLLTLFWGQQSFLFKFLKYIDSAIRALLFSNEEQKRTVLQWLSEVGPVRVEDLDTVWRQGWILCGVLDAALPGACPGHPPTGLSLKHAQAVADHYLGVSPVFSRQEFDSSNKLSKHHEWKLISYLDQIRLAISKLAPPVTKTGSQRTYIENSNVTLDYIARGSGLSAAQLNSFTHFKIYPTSQQCLDPGEIIIVIKGPQDSYGMNVLPPILGKAQLIRQKLLGMQSVTSFTENVLPLAHGTTYLRYYGKNNMNKTYYIPKTKNNIKIEVERQQDHIKIGYQVDLEGKYEISITSKGQNIVGSPFFVTASHNIVEILEKESFCLEDGEEIDIVDVKSERKVVLRIVDFVTEKMLLKENGALEKISEDEAKYLMENDVKDKEISNISSPNNQKKLMKNNTKEYLFKFNEIAHKILKINKICNIFYSLIDDKLIKSKDRELHHQPRSQQDIPDIVNSTLSDSDFTTYTLTDKRNKIIIPENIFVSILTEKQETVEKQNEKEVILSEKQSEFNLGESKIHTMSINDEIVSIDTLKSSNNPFFNEASSENNVTEKSLHSFPTSESKNNKSESKTNEETKQTSIQFVVENITETTPLIQNNPFSNPDILNINRPKSPIFRITEDDIITLNESIDINSRNNKNSNETINNEFINPFFTHEQNSISHHVQNLPTADFIIGAPVSVPPNIRALSPEMEIKPTTIPFIQNTNAKDHMEIRKSNDMASITSSLQNTLQITSDDSLLELYANNIEIRNEDFEFKEHIDFQHQLQQQMEENITSKKEMWDSAYVSIDENNSTADNNNNDKNTSLTESLSDNMIDFSNMGPAEKEIWQTCTELKTNIKNDIQDDMIKYNKRESKKLAFTPIVEESDKSIYANMKDVMTESLENNETDPVTIAFAEINDLYQDYFPNSEDSNSKVDDNYKTESLEIQNNVDSASKRTVDVKRHEKITEGEISEIQTNVTESVSVSQTLHEPEKNANNVDAQNNKKTLFGDNEYTNIVMEKKRYWDDKIRQIEAKAEESRAQQKKRRLSSKQIRHNDSLSKRKGKQIVKKYLNLNEAVQKPTNSIENQQTSSATQIFEKNETDVKRVKNWKAYWDTKLENENKENQKSNVRVNSPSCKNKTIQGDTGMEVTELQSYSEECKTTEVPVKQDLPEEVFKAFETSPKRFFGTSRKQIMNKIDTFLGKPSSIDEPTIDNSVTSYETGLVSSRISLFHNISQTEELPWGRKCKSMHNIYQQKDFKNDKSSTNHNENLLLDTETYVSTKENANEEENIENMLSIKEKRAQMSGQFCNKSFDETVYMRAKDDTQGGMSHNDTIKTFDNGHTSHFDNLRKISSSKSEMDIFNKFANKSLEDDFDKYKSFDELPKINVRNFITLYEDASKNSLATQSQRKIYNNSPTCSDKYFKPASSSSGTAVTFKGVQNNKLIEHSDSIEKDPINSDCPNPINAEQRSINPSPSMKETGNDTITIENATVRDKKTISTFISLSDFDLEIVEKCSDKSMEELPQEATEISPTDYKSRFKIAKQYFQSLEELREVKKPSKINECELLLYNKSTESLVKEKESKRLRKKTKSRSMPSSDISHILNQLQEQQRMNNDGKLVKISEKFNVEDLFADVMEGKLSRQGSLRGIPHKKAVLETFRSMENIMDNKLSPYEIAVSQLSDFAKENEIKNAQTYLSEYPYLPTTDPSKYHSRLDANASGLISFKELLNKRVRRNSVPDLRLNPSFSADL